MVLTMALPHRQHPQQVGLTLPLHSPITLLRPLPSIHHTTTTHIPTPTHTHHTIQLLPHSGTSHNPLLLHILLLVLGMVLQHGLPLVHGNMDLLGEPHKLQPLLQPTQPLLKHHQLHTTSSVRVQQTSKRRMLSLLLR